MHLLSSHHQSSAGREVGGEEQEMRRMKSGGPDAPRKGKRCVWSLILLNIYVDEDARLMATIIIAFRHRLKGTRRQSQAEEEECCVAIWPIII